MIIYSDDERGIKRAMKEELAKGNQVQLKRGKAPKPKKVEEAEEKPAFVKKGK